MHQSSLQLMGEFIQAYLTQGSTVLDIGASSDYASYRELVEAKDCSYKSLDWEKADYVVKGYDWACVPKASFDCVISGQAFEHDKYFWKTMANISQVMKPNALFMCIAPSKGGLHQYPVDCYRFYPDTAIVFAELLAGEVVDVVWNNERAVNSTGRKVKHIHRYQVDTKHGDLGIVIKRGSY